MDPPGSRRQGRPREHGLRPCRHLSRARRRAGLRLRRGGPIVFRSYPGERPTLDGQGLEVPADFSGMISIESQHHVTVQGFEIRGYRTAESGHIPAGVWVSGRPTTFASSTPASTIWGRTSRGRSGGDAHGIAVYGTDSSRHPRRGDRRQRAVRPDAGLERSPDGQRQRPGVRDHRERGARHRQHRDRRDRLRGEGRGLERGPGARRARRRQPRVRHRFVRRPGIRARIGAPTASTSTAGGTSSSNAA